MLRVLGLVILVGGAEALKTKGKSAIASESASQGVSAQELWAQAWSSTLERFHVASMAQLPDYLQNDLQKEAKKLWKSWLQKRQRMIEEREQTSTTEAFTTVAAVFERLTEGIKDVQDEPARTTTTTTEDPDVVMKREQDQELYAKSVSKLTAGVKEARDDQPREDSEEMKKWKAQQVEQEYATMTTTTQNAALRKLLAGIDGPADADVSLAQAPVSSSTTAAAATTTSTTTTTTTVEPRIEEERERAVMMKKEAMSRLTAGFADADKKEAEKEATMTTTTTTTVATTTTKNLALMRLMEGVDGPAAPAPAGKKHHSTTSTTTTTTASTTIGEAGKKVLSFITSGTFAMPPPASQVVEADSKDDAADDDSKPDNGDGGEAAADFDMDNAA